MICNLGDPISLPHPVFSQISKVSARFFVCSHCCPRHSSHHPVYHSPHLLPHHLPHLLIVVHNILRNFSRTIIYNFLRTTLYTFLCTCSRIFPPFPVLFPALFLLIYACADMTHLCACRHDSFMSVLTWLIYECADMTHLWVCRHDSFMSVPTWLIYACAESCYESYLLLRVPWHIVFSTCHPFICGALTHSSV